MMMQFVVGMNAQKKSKIWEYETMMEMLNEEITKDELVFYLHCRHVLHHGPMLLK